MSPLRAFALAFGVVFLLVGICGFVPACLTAPTPMPAMPGMAPPHDGLTVTAFDGYLFGLFHVNAVHSAAHLLFGVLGLAMAGRAASARAYAVVVCLAYGGLVVLGLIPATNTLFGLCPLHGNDVWLHVGLAAVAGVFAFLVPSGGSPIDPLSGGPVAAA